MPKELKIHLTDRVATEQKLTQLGAKFTGENHAIHTYFNQPVGHVLKLAESKEGTKLIRFERQGNGFVKVADDPVEDSAARKAALTEEYGVDSWLDMRYRTYQLGSYTFDIFQIAGLGDFLIQTADDPDPAYFTKLGISKPNYVTVPFNKLAKNSD
jgi:adenylate cyclase class IV